MARQLQLKLPLFHSPRSHQEAMRGLLAARELRCELAPRVELVAACHAPLLLLAGVPIGVRYIDWTLVMFHPDGTIGLDIGEMYHSPGAYRTIMDCMPEGWRLVRRRDTLYFELPGQHRAVAAGRDGHHRAERGPAARRARPQRRERRRRPGSARQRPARGDLHAGWGGVEPKFNELLMGRSG